jgi:hypothetical protein
MAPGGEKSDLVQGTLEMLILKTLTLGPLRGYAIAQHIARTSDDVLRVEQGSLYPALERLLAKGLGHGEVGRDVDQAARPLLHHHGVGPEVPRRGRLRLRPVGTGDRPRARPHLTRRPVSWLHAVRHRAAVLLRGTAYAREVQEEMRFHLELETMHQRREALSEIDAAHAALWAGRLLTTQLYGVKVGDPVTLGRVAALLIVIAALATWIPARRAARVDPIVAMPSD